MKKLLAVICSVLCVGLCACGEIEEESQNALGHIDAGSQAAENEVQKSEENTDGGDSVASTVIVDESIASCIIDNSRSSDEGKNDAKTDSQSADNTADEFIEGAKDCITKWTEYMSNAEYSKAAELMTEEFAEETNMSEMVDGEDKTAVTIAFNDESVSVTDASDGKVYIKIEITLIPEEEPDFAMPAKVIVVYDGEKYLFSGIDEEISSDGHDIDSSQLYADCMAKTVFNAAALLTADMETEGKTVPDGDYDKNSDSEYAERLDEILRNYDIGGDYTVTIQDDIPVKVTYTDGEYTGQYPGENTFRTDGN